MQTKGMDMWVQGLKEQVERIKRVALTYTHCCCCCCCCCQVASVVSDSVRPHRRQPTRLPWPWDSPGKSTGVGCHFLLQCMKVKSESHVAQSCLTLCDPMDCRLPGSSVHGIFQAKVLEWGAITLDKGRNNKREYFPGPKQTSNIGGPESFGYS